MTDIYIYRERERETEFLELIDLSSMKYSKTKSPKKHILNDARFFRTRQKQYASARMAVGIIKSGGSKRIQQLCYVGE